ncbi:MAG: carbohydrate ABC transporter permease [Gorillibacterium sp.]|nr:carbohydrate ABC transporter permease [Gorillibacterium sp.]
MVRSRTLGTKIADWSIIAILLLVSLSSLFPILHNLAVSMSKPSLAEAGFITVLPQGFNLDAYAKIIDDTKFFRAFWVSVQRVVAVTLLSFVITVMMAYPLSKQNREFYMRNIYMWLFIFCMMFSGGLIPGYLVIKQMGLMNSFMVLVIPSLVNIFNVILVLNYFRSIPREMEESASMDGAGPWYMLFKIFIPLSLPVLATTTLFLMVGVWNEFTTGMIFITNDKLIPLQTYMQQIVVNIDPTLTDLDQIKKLAKLSNKTLTAAKIFVSMLPILIVYPMLQKYFISGIMLGSVKE